ncbi:MAG: alpha/beta fold hydrolase [Janthinobacterium lividum]
MIPLLPFSDCGSGDTVLLFLHFFGSSQREWRHVIDRLAPTHRCVAADMPGFGDARDIIGYSVAEMTDHLRRLVAHFAPAPVVLVAHSFSGKPAMVLAAEPPENLQSLILVAPTTLVPEPITDKNRVQMRVRDRSREGAEAFIDGSHSRALNHSDLELAVEDVLRANVDAWLAWPDSGSLEDWSGRITELRVPAHMIVGDRDEAIPLDFQREHTLPMVERTGGRLTVIEDAAHMLPSEAPAELAIAISGALM